MNRNATRFIRIGSGHVGLLVLAWALAGQAAKPAQHGIALPTDWSHRHLIFSQPRTPEERAWVERDPRYWQQLARNNQRFALSSAPNEISAPADFKLTTAAKHRFHRDWAENMGAGATVGAGNFPAKFSFSSTTANCGNATTPDFVVFSTGLAGSSSQANILAFDNLYSGCIGTVPSVYWAYNITDSHISTGQVLTSPVLSRDGSQIAFVQDNGIFASLIMLKWAASTTETATSPGTVTSVIPSLYRTCTAPCITTIDLRSGLGTSTRDFTSSVFYDYSADIAWVGDNQGWLHKFTGIFKGLPSEVTSGGFPVQMTAASQLSNPVFDRLTRTVFVGDYSGFLYHVDAATAAVTQSSEVDFGAGLVAGPIVDTLNGLVYVSASSDGSAACSGGADCAGLFQFPASFAAGDTGTEAIVGVSTIFGMSTPNPMYDGFFDNSYFTSGNATGNFYVCGNTGANPTLYVVPIQAGVLGTPAVIGTLASSLSTAACSPVTDVSIPGLPGNAATEHVFVSVQNNSTASGCGSGGCIQNFIDTPWQASTAFTAGQEILIKSSSPLSRLINVVITAGTSGTTQPSWPSATGATKMDGTVIWLNQGNIATPINSWQATHSYNAVGLRILDSNGNVEVVTTKGTSGSSPPSWATTAGSPTTDGTVKWINAGAFPSSALSAAGGTSGIIIDNTVGAGTLAGASQVYFSTQSNQLCTTSGTSGGCAVQASQPALK